MTREARGLHRGSRTLAVVTHHAYGDWLDSCVESLVRQDRPPDGIVVLDDATARPPTHLSKRFPAVTVMTTEVNVGHYRLLQQIIDDTDHEAFLLQDSDDWSAPNRLAMLLEGAVRRNSEFVGCQVTNVFSGCRRTASVRYPADCTAAILAAPACHPLFFSASLLSRGAAIRAGGLATGLRWGADSEFIRRAVLVERVVNIGTRCYFRRVHPASATQSPETGFGSRLREEIQRRNHERSRANVARYRRGEEIDLTPIALAPPIPLVHLSGPELTTARSRSRPG